MTEQERKAHFQWQLEHHIAYRNQAQADLDRHVNRQKDMSDRLIRQSHYAVLAVLREKLNEEQAWVDHYTNAIKNS